jgi:hypothetical protein
MLDSGVRRCKHSLGVNNPFAAKFFYGVNVCKQSLHLDKHERLMRVGYRPRWSAQTGTPFT